MKQYFLFTRIVFTLALTVVVIGFSAFSQNQQKSTNSFQKEQLSRDNDTGTSRRRDRAGRDMDQLEKEMRNLDIQMKNLGDQIKNMDFEKAEKQLNEAMQKIDREDITKQTDKSTKDIDRENLRDQIDKFAKINRLQMKDAKKQIDLAKINFEKQKSEFGLNSSKMKENFEKSMKNVRKSMENAKEEIKNFNELTNALEKDGLIDKSKAYKIELRNGELYINDKKQPKEISDKYRKYFRKSNFTINMNEEDGVRV